MKVVAGKKEKPYWTQMDIVLEIFHP